MSVICSLPHSQLRSDIPYMIDANRVQCGRVSVHRAANAAASVTNGSDGGQPGGQPRLAVRARMPSVARSAPSDSTGKMFAAFQSGWMSDQS